eukprot:TRINITY_DN26631_c0_g1_i1.p2 TRINITY_DN26631_c0_g1~~TRINITY_DN26631_c0_g1_i1.p2  ORF type:complete len:212 (+),score=57.40 TRINITY_DN26631_c0_g1_i1:159-794(+)
MSLYCSDGFRRAQSITADCFKSVPTRRPESKDYRGYSLVYDEISPERRAFLLRNFEEYAPLAAAPAGKRAFVDLGSGRGMVALEFSMIPGVERSVGIEITKERSDCALIARENLRLVNPIAARRLELIEGSFLNVNMTAACWLWSYNTMFPEQTMLSLFQRLEQELRPGAVIVLDQQPPAACLRMFEALEARLPCPRANGYVYRKLTHDLT